MEYLFAGSIQNINLYSREAHLYPDQDENGIDGFAIASEACSKAGEFWDEIAASKQPTIEELQARIKAIQESVRVETVEKVRAFYKGNPGERWVECYLTTSLEEGGDPEDWLNW